MGRESARSPSGGGCGAVLLDECDAAIDLASSAALAPSIGAFVEATGLLLARSELRAGRLLVSLATLHPSFRARTYLWKRDTSHVRLVEWPHGLKNRPGHYGSPDYHVQE